MNCVMCENPLKESKRRTRLYCSQRCSSRAHYRRHKEYYQEGAKRWRRLNLEKAKESCKKSLLKYRTGEGRKNFNASMMKSYRKNKDRWHSRSNTRSMIKGLYGFAQYDPLTDECKKCKIKENLEIHHEIYPTRVKEIRNAMDEGKIYYLCGSCHGELSKVYKPKN